jgi:hypothetical protein
MTFQDRKTLLLFVLRTGMYIQPCNDNNISSFITGYDIGRNMECFFVEKLQKELTHTYKAGATNDGWRGQIHRLSKRKSLEWVVIFKQIALEIIMNIDENSQKEELTEIFKTRFTSLFEHFNEKSLHFRYEEWVSLYSKNKWFLELWTNKELKEIKAINKVILQQLN